jgi:hypothetical protein
MTATNTTAATHYIVRTSKACMPVKCWGTYRHVAVIEVDAGVDDVSMISTRAKGVRRIVARWDRKHVGSTDRCAYEIALAEAEEMADRLNAAATIGGAA